MIFDASGTILDDIEAVWRANAMAYESFGIEGVNTLEAFKAKFKLPIQEFHTSNGIPPDRVIDVDCKFREYYPRFAQKVDIFPEVKEVLRELQKKGILMGIASNIPRLFLAEHLSKFEITSYFDVITGQEDCSEQKPSPKPVIATVNKLGIKSSEAIFIGDMEEDIIAGKAAGVTTAAIVRDKSYHPRWRLEKQKPDYFISSLWELMTILSSS